MDKKETLAAEKLPRKRLGGTRLFLNHYTERGVFVIETRFQTLSECKSIHEAWSVYLAYFSAGTPGYSGC